MEKTNPLNFELCLGNRALWPWIPLGFPFIPFTKCELVASYKRRQRCLNNTKVASRPTWNTGVDEKNQDLGAGPHLLHGFAYKSQPVVFFSVLAPQPWWCNLVSAGCRQWSEAADQIHLSVRGMSSWKEPSEQTPSPVLRALSCSTALLRTWARNKRIEKFGTSLVSRFDTQSSFPSWSLLYLLLLFPQRYLTNKDLESLKESAKSQFNQVRQELSWGFGRVSDKVW